jgi:hypothetical protein
MTYVIDGSVQARLDQAGDTWIVTIGYLEVVP